MRRICVFRDTINYELYCHCIDEIFNGEAFDCSPDKFMHVSDTKKLILIHVHCHKSLESVHNGCDLFTKLGKDLGHYKCRLSPQVRIKKILVLDDNAKKRKHLQLLNESYVIVGYDYENEDKLYASIANPCNIDFININFTGKLFILSTCPECGDSDKNYVYF